MPKPPPPAPSLCALSAMLTFFKESKAYAFDKKCLAYLAKVEATIGEGPTNNKGALLGMAESIHSKK